MKLEELIAAVIHKKERVYFIGIKGTGMCALAELLHQAGARISGSDTAETFYTCEILDELHIPYFEGFDAAHITRESALVIHSAAYTDANPEVAAARKFGIPLVKYTDALGAYSALFDSSGIAGVHGKTTTTAIAGTLLAAAKLPAQTLAGSAVKDFGGRSTINAGNKYFVAETCEYRRHFLSFHPRRVLLTSVESDHQDYYPDYPSILAAFIEYGERIAPGGELIYCADDAGARETASVLKERRSDISYTPYGFNAKGDFRITRYETREGAATFELVGIAQQWTLHIPGRHTALNSAGALALVRAIARAEGRPLEPMLGELSRALAAFSGSKRRTEIIGEAGGILFMDDYAHHPTAIKTTLAGLREFYPRRRLVVSFMPHTYSRTAALLADFAAAFEDADIVFLHKIYGSARELYDGGVTGATLFEQTKARQGGVFYAAEPLDALDQLKATLRSGDIFITLGAGDNWRLSAALFNEYSSEKGGRWRVEKHDRFRIR
ncbi:MAG: UDP-N-acetylmuramate--L-alanine ligase [Spirochaetaceae bacterium]|jgi:UDP-N-acetylmuramate--alanine ligase|nr:UDP-N-acetylmuramate--L-alanine ligase [Spirochaetaceae bacterium]